MEYEIIRSHRKTVAIQITNDGRVLVRCPMRAKASDLQRLVESRKDWIAAHLAALTPIPPLFTQTELETLTQQAKAWIPERTAFWAKQMGLSYGRVTIRHQRSCWGSCSGKGNLNFNCLLMLFPREVADYVIIHELCHRVNLNHSKEFWALVAKFDPDYATHRSWLKDQGRVQIERIP